MTEEVKVPVIHSQPLKLSFTKIKPGKIRKRAKTPQHLLQGSNKRAKRHSSEGSYVESVQLSSAQIYQQPEEEGKLSVEEKDTSIPQEISTPDSYSPSTPGWGIAKYDDMEEINSSEIDYAHIMLEETKKGGKMRSKRMVITPEENHFSSAVCYIEGIMKSEDGADRTMHGSGLLYFHTD